MNDTKFSIENSDEPSIITPEEYESLVEDIAEEASIGTQAEVYDSEDEGINQILENHLFLLDYRRASQVIALSHNSPKGWREVYTPGDGYSQVISSMAKTCLIKDLRDKVEERQ